MWLISPFWLTIVVYYDLSRQGAEYSEVGLLETCLAYLTTLLNVIMKIIFVERFLVGQLTFIMYLVLFYSNQFSHACNSYCLYVQFNPHFMLLSVWLLTLLLSKPVI